MRILFDIVHPADVHFFKHTVRRLAEEGHEVLLTSREKDIVVQLLAELRLPNRIVSRQGRGPLGLLAELGRRDVEIYRLAREFRPHVLVGNNSPSVAHVGLLLRRPSIVFDDTEINRYVRILYRGFVTEVHTPRCYRRDLGTKQVRYPGYHALAYLHPDHFEPDPAPLAAQGLSTDDPYFLFRFVRWGASHDIGVRGLTQNQKEELVDLARGYGQVVISAEDELPESLAQYRFKMRVADMHQLVAGAAGLFGESATMCSEAACLGVP
jgi:predicted glycosyltransferase